MKKTSRVVLLLRKFIYKELSPQEDVELKEWVNSDKTYRDYVTNLKNNISKEYADYQQLNSEKGAQAQRRMLSVIKERVDEPPVRYFKWKYFSLAASVIILISASLLFIPKFVGKYKTETIISHVVKPGGKRAFLRTEDGNLIDLGEDHNGIAIKDGKISYTEDNMHLLELGKVRNLEIVTPLGGEYQVVLPDQSKVWLNAGSSLKYPSTFNDSSVRKVELSGEAYFEVTKNAAKPFVVVSNGQEIKVTGTSFNVFTYAEEKVTKTTLVEGQVYVYKSATKRENTSYQMIKLMPGEEVSNSNEAFKKYKVDIAMAIAWKEGNFHFNNTPLEVMMRQISRWYNVEVVYVSSIPKESFTGEMSRKVDLPVVMDFLKGSGIKVKLKENTLYIE
jgi:transmembrane sensor